MIFKDRAEAGKRLAETLAKDKDILKERKNIIVLSLLRGGAIVSYQLAKKLSLPHFPLVVKKIGAPFNEELAIGAVCNNEYFLDNNLMKRLSLDKDEIGNQIKKTKQKQKEYLKKFMGRKKTPSLKNKIVILVDDGIATGASAMVALKYLKKQKAKKIILAIPVAPTDFNPSGFDKAFILHKDSWFNAVSQFYQEFSQLSDEEVRCVFSSKERW
ncbi:phosphoribosyltransferase [Candidatus Gribaldobacteria bacterium]|nr:phosphoribosyltransferase [Candidatus Gribaldobacteria bacterium]